MSNIRIGSVMSTNIRVGPGVYLILKELSENTGMSMGSWANLFIFVGLTGGGKVTESLSNISTDIQNALVADVMSAIGDLFKVIGMESIKNTSIAELYQSLLKPSKDSNLV